MSVLIKGMEMPKTGEYRCVIRKWGEEITVDLYGDEELCGKLIPVPDHGRVIDADALVKENAMAWGTEDIIRIAKAQTIIPADRKEEI